MKIEQLDLTVREFVEDYEDAGEDGVTGYGGKLDIRPPFQREFIYNDKERNAVIDSILKGCPLNVMYWADREDGTFEIIDGQQRTISIAQYDDGDFSLNRQAFVLGVPTNSQSKRWKQTISHPGPRAARPTRIIARCFVKSVTGRSLHDNQTARCTQVK